MVEPQPMSSLESANEQALLDAPGLSNKNETFSTREKNSTSVDHETPESSSRSNKRPRFDVDPMTSLEQGGASGLSISPEPLTTPTWMSHESDSKPSRGKLHIKKNLSFKSLRELEMQQLQGAVWRPGGREGEPGEKRHRPRNLDELANHALSGGLRSFLLGCGLRAGVNLVVVFLRVTKKKGISGRAILHALFGEDTFRFGGMLGTFTFLYKWTIHFLRLVNPNRKSENWHAALAGAISGISVLAEKPSRRVTIGQQLLVRGLQGNYNVLKRRGYVHLPNGDVILFGLACGQIMYSWLMAPEALPPGYRRFVTGASRVAEPALPVNLSATRSHTFDPAIARQAITWKRGATPHNEALIEAYASRAEKGDFGPPFAPCEVVHPWIDDCKWVAVDRWQAVFRWMVPVYAALHFIPPMLLRYKVFKQDPTRVLLKSAIGTMRSCSFLATFVCIFQSLVCLQRNIYNAQVLPKFLEKILLHRSFYWFSGFTTCLSLFIEEKKRRGELAMYVLPRGLESLWSILRKRSWVPFVPGGDVVLTSIGLASVMHTYEHDPKMLSGLVRAILWQFVWVLTLASLLPVFGFYEIAELGCYLVERDLRREETRTRRTTFR